ncbi:MAG: hypothetical protein ACOX5Z_00625 [Desulfobulbus sp.]|jgi:hypothetical protein
MRRVFLFLLIGLICGCAFVSTMSAANRVSFRGLTPGVSTLGDTIRILGAPRSRISEKDYLICKYRTMSVVIPHNSGRIEYIVIADPDFVDVNGFQLDSTYEEISEKLGLQASGNTVLDTANGVLYIFDQDGYVTQIVYRNIAG